MKVDDYRKAYAERLDRVFGAPQALAADGGAGPTLDVAIAAVGDAGKPPSVRLSALRVVQAATFLGPAFDPYRAAFREALRAALANGDAILRERALSLLAIENDDVARDALRVGLEEPARAAVPPAKAIQLLGLDDHGVAVPIARKLLDESPDAHVKEEALRALAAAPDAGDVFARVLSDKGQPADLRAVGASGLRMLDPERFAREAERIVADDSEDDLVRARCLGALAHLQGQGPTQIDPALVERVERLALPDAAEPLRTSAQGFLDRVSRR